MQLADLSAPLARENSMKILSFLMGVAWIIFGIFILLTYGVELSSRFFGALSIIGTGIIFVWYGVIKKSSPSSNK